MRALLCLVVLTYVGLSHAVDRTNFKTCAQSGFCKRQREITEPTGFKVDTESITFNDTALHAKLKIKEQTLNLTIVTLKDSTIRVVINEENGNVRNRYQPLDALKEKEPAQQKIKKTKSDETATKVLTEDGHRVVLIHNPFRIDFYSKEKLVTSINSNGLLNVEPFKKKVLMKDRTNNYWEETFKDFQDTKPFGASSVSIDIAFIGMKFAYGLPEHADSFALRDTKNYEPYRLYNLDVFQYELNNPMALYGSIPYMVAVNPKRTVGVLWLNAAETWVDYETIKADKGKLAKIIEDSETKAKETYQINTRFISETGVIDIFVLLGQKPADSFRQLSTLTGVYPLPPDAALGYHQSRWNYKNQKDVIDVVERFEKEDIPLDYIWLDIEHTDGKRYFTWDKEEFSNPGEMVEKLGELDKKLVVIVDPHIKKDKEYPVYKEAKKKGYFIKSNDGRNIYEGNCWPGDSSYLDFTNPEVREYWSGLYAFDKFNGTNKDVHIWNDMNEPSVFSGPEITMHKDAIHNGGLEHREVHNMYGFYQHSATYEGLKARSEGEYRPFVLSRAFFAGSQRTAAVWTGDNVADWAHLKASIPMLLSMSAAGLPHVGADVGGFFGDPDEELLTRWYQAGAFQPFFRAHAHLDSKRREPWMFGETTMNNIKEAIERRYQMIPYWYTLFYEHTITGKPPMRPFWLEFSEDENSYDEDRQWMVGNAILVKPIMESKPEQASIYLPGKREVWYDWDTSKARPSPGAVQTTAEITKIPVYQRGGTIVPLHDVVYSSAGKQRDEPVTLYIALNMKGDFANGTIYLDDGETYAYEKGDFAYWGITFKREHDYLHTITSKSLDKKGTLISDVYINKIVVRGAKFYPRNAHIYLDDFTPDGLDFEYDRETFLMEINGLSAPVTKEFQIDIHT